jgi:quercetin dioxygenase-like cupin family protein
MKQKSLSNAKAVDMMEGIVRKTLTYNDDAMLCHIEMKQGAKIPLHHHEPVQIGICLSGKIRFIGENAEDEFIAAAGDGYIMDSNKPHGAVALEDSAVVEVFTPSRPEYADF